MTTMIVEYSVLVPFPRQSMKGYRKTLLFK
jgi:hypothetical protein